MVTGADGFIGSHLVERLARTGADVRAFCVYNSNGSYGWLDELDEALTESVEFRLGDVRDYRSVRDAVEGVDVVFHLAALIAIPYSYQAPRSFVDTNVNGTLNILEAAREEGRVRVINTSTSEVYGTPETVPITEHHPIRGQSPYAASKIGADQLCESYVRSFGVNAVTLRPFNTFGPRQSARAIIPTLLGQLLAGSTTVQVGNADPKRDFTYVEDTVEGFLRMALADVPAGTVLQLGTGHSISIADLFRECCEVLGVRAELVSDPARVRPRAGEVEILLSDPRQAKEKLGWQAEWSLGDGLKSTADWLRNRVDPARAMRYQR
ncbi:SDR family NAD(P)-dependent oxidoreductase [Amycolatopsis bartoniae]|nr:SDR family NAD(P)-dependent oxidoreductase [Amycolatopsis bartoniae]